MIWSIEYANPEIKARLKNDCLDHVVCKHWDDEYLSERDVAIESRFTLAGTVSAREYEIGVESATPLDFELDADIDAAVLTFDVVDASSYLQHNDYIELGSEKMVINTVVGDTVTVFARGHGTSDASAHTAGAGVVSKIGTVKNFCEETGACEIFVNEGKIVNAVQKHQWCVSWCAEDLCALTRNCDCEADKAQVVDDFLTSAELKSRARNIKLLDRTAVKGVYQSWDNADGTAGSTAGLMEYATGIKTSTGNTISGLMFDAQDVSDNACYVAGDESTYSMSHDLIKKYLEKVYLAEGKHNIAFVNPNDVLGMTFLVPACQTGCDNGNSNGVSFQNASVIPGTPFGDIEIVASNNIPQGTIVFAHTSNLKKYAYCANRGQLFTTTGQYQPTPGVEKYKQDFTGYFAYDASQNMCTDLGVITNFVISAC